MANGGAAAVLSLCLGAVWFDLVYFAPKALTEVVAGHLLVPALALGLAAAPNSRRPIFAASLLLGLAASLRPHVAPGACLAWAWLVCRSPRDRLGPALAGATLAVLPYGLVDWFTHGYPFASVVGNIGFNVGDGSSLEFGWLPAHYYAVYLWDTWTPAVAIVFGGLWLLGVRRAPLPAVTALAILGSHSLIGHKEYRFVYPALPLLLINVAVGASVLVERVRPQRRRIATAAFAAAFATTSIWAGSDFHRAKTPTGLGDRRTAVSYWHAFGDGLRAMRDLSRRDDVKGVAVAGIPWQFSGGYTWLHRDVPLFFFPRTVPGSAWPHVNYAIARDADVPPDFAEVARFGEVRVLHRGGEVVAAPGYDVNDVLKGR
jgi:hypothetical protein